MNKYIQLTTNHALQRRVVNGPTTSGPNPKMQARFQPEPENNLKL